MKIVVPGLKMDLIDLSTNRANVGCDAEIAEPRSGKDDDIFKRVGLCLSTGILRG